MKPSKSRVDVIVTETTFIITLYMDLLYGMLVNDTLLKQSS